MFSRLVSLVQHLHDAYLKWKYGEEVNELPIARYSQDASENDPNARHPHVVQIVVADERSKEELITALRYIHDRAIDTDYKAVNELVHIYRAPELITIEK